MDVIHVTIYRRIIVPRHIFMPLFADRFADMTAPDRLCILGVSVALNLGVAKFRPSFINLQDVSFKLREEGFERR